MPNLVPNPRDPSNQYDSLVSRLRQMKREGNPLRAPAIAVVSYESGAGVTSVTRALASRMNSGPIAHRMAEVTVSLSPDEFTNTASSMTDFLARLFEQHESALELFFEYPGEEENCLIRDDPERTLSFEDYIAAARSLFSCILVECVPLKRSTDIATIAPLVDGVLIVVEANKTTRAQTERLVHIIQTAGGSVLGYILNKQTFPIPPSIYQLFEKAGVL
jgi:Mrp family chromosome partitioning ATPase